MASRMRWSTAASSARCAAARKLVDVEQRQRAAGDLLGAAERIAVERLEQAAASSAVERPTDSATAPVPGTRSANRSLESVRLSPLAIGFTVRRVEHLRRRLDRHGVAALQRRSRPGR